GKQRKPNQITGRIVHKPPDQLTLVDEHVASLICASERGPSRPPAATLARIAGLELCELPFHPLLVPLSPLAIVAVPFRLVADRYPHVRDRIAGSPAPWSTYLFGQREQSVLLQCFVPLCRKSQDVPESPLDVFGVQLWEIARYRGQV